MAEPGNSVLVPYQLEPHKGWYDNLPFFSWILPSGAKIRGKETHNPLIINFGGPTGSGKTVLATFYSKEEGIRYNLSELAKQAGIRTDLEAIKKFLNLNQGGDVNVYSVPKFTTREPRDSEAFGIHHYFVSKEEFGRLEKHMLFTYRYPNNEDGALYGVPKSIRWPLKSGIDSVITMSGYESFSRVSRLLSPDIVSIYLDGYPKDIESHIMGRRATEQEKQSRLDSYVEDRRDFFEHRHELPYSVFIPSYKSINVDITPGREKSVTLDLDNAIRQVKAIVKFERHLRSEGIDTTQDPQVRFDYFIRNSTRALFGDRPYEELKEILERGESVPVFDSIKDKELIEKYSGETGITRSLLERIADKVRVNAALDANGRRTIVLSGYSQEYIPSTRDFDKAVMVHLLQKKLNGIGTSIANKDPGTYNTFSLLSALEFKGGVDEALFLYLSSDHVPIIELNRPRAINIVFSRARDPKEAQSTIRKPTLEELIQVSNQITRGQEERSVFELAIRPSSN